MSDEEPEQLQQGSEEPPLTLRLPSPPPWVRVVAAVVVLLLSGAVLLHQRHEQGPVAAPSPSPSATTTEPVSYFNVTAICPPVLDGDNVLTVSFTLTNTTSSSVTVRRIEPSFPMGALQASSIDVAGGICGHPGLAPPGLHIDPGASLLVTFRLLLSPDCPKPYPVAARVVVLVPSGREPAEVVPVYPDLGSIDFPNCP